MIKLIRTCDNLKSQDEGGGRDIINKQNAWLETKLVGNKKEQPDQGTKHNRIIT